MEKSMVFSSSWPSTLIIPLMRKFTKWHHSVKWRVTNAEDLNSQKDLTESRPPLTMVQQAWASSTEFSVKIPSIKCMENLLTTTKYHGTLMMKTLLSASMEDILSLLSPSLALLPSIPLVRSQRRKLLSLSPSNQSSQLSQSTQNQQSH